MPKNLKLLLIENVDALGIVGDVVTVRTGYARNFLLPRNLATTPSEELIQQLATKRVEAQKLIAQQRKHREELVTKLQGVEITLVKSCNDQGVLYGAITQQEVAAALNGQGYAVKPRDVRLPVAIKRIDNYELHIKLDNDLDALLKLYVKPDRELDMAKAKQEEEAQEHVAEQATRRRKDMIDLAAEDEAAKKATKGTWGKAAGSADAAEPAAEAAKKGGKKGKDEGDGEKKAKADKPKAEGKKGDKAKK